MIRYFMTIPEAAQLVLQAAWLWAKGGEILRAGHGRARARILDLAKRT